jgi:L-serine dehydratase
MTTSLFDIFSIGIGPSSSHTVGPMRAALRFVKELSQNKVLEKTESVVVELYGSLALTGKGHSTDRAVLLGLSGYTPEGVDPDLAPQICETISSTKKLRLLDKKEIDFEEEKHLLFLKDKRLPYHSNAMRVKAFDGKNKQLHTQVYYSIGGGFVLSQEEAVHGGNKEIQHPFPYPFKTAEELLEHAKKENKTIYDIVLENEKTLRTPQEIKVGILRIWQTMKDCVNRGLDTEGELPGGLKVQRRAHKIYKQLQKTPDDPSNIFEWVSLFALAVNEENAGCGRVVTAPTNGASGIIPAVLHYYERYVPSFSEEGVEIFFLTAAAMCILFKEGASLSAAEMGCQGEVGVACSMAAAGLAAVLGGSNEQIENAAEIAMEHNLGLTCDPIGGLVQVPCIERNTMGAIKAINAAKLALRGDGTHVVSLDSVIRVMKKTGEDMKHVYKETSLGGLASEIFVNISEC